MLKHQYETKFFENQINNAYFFDSKNEEKLLPLASSEFKINPINYPLRNLKVGENDKIAINNNRIRDLDLNSYYADFKGKDLDDNLKIDKKFEYTSNNTDKIIKTQLDASKFHTIKNNYSRYPLYNYMNDKNLKEIKANKYDNPYNFKEIQSNKLNNRVTDSNEIKKKSRRTKDELDQKLFVININQVIFYNF